MEELKNVLLHCLNNDTKYSEYKVESKDQHINQGWIEALRYVIANYNITKGD